MGAQSPRRAGPLTPLELSNAAFPYLSARETTVGDVPVRAVRVTFVLELLRDSQSFTAGAAGS